jgi:hypothetical protein
MGAAAASPAVRRGELRQAAARRHEGLSYPADTVPIMAMLPPPWPVVPLAAKRPAPTPVPGPAPRPNPRRTPPTFQFRSARRADPRLTAGPRHDNGQDDWGERTAAYAARVRGEARDRRPRASVATAGAALARDLIARTRREHAGVP